MIPTLPKENLFHVMLRDLAMEAQKVGAFISEYKWYLAAAAGAAILLFLITYRGDRQ